VAVMSAELGKPMAIEDRMKVLSTDFDWEKAKSDMVQRDKRILEHAIGILYQEQYTMLEQLFEQKRSMMDVMNINVDIKKSMVE